MTELAAIAKLPAHEQPAALEQLQITHPIDPLFAPGLTVWYLEIAHAHLRYRAVLRSAIAALAAERYRLQKDRWPETFDALVPDYLEAVPIDPYSGEPLRLRRLADGLVIYSVGEDRVDNSGQFENQPGRKGIDLGFRLWDVHHRRQPPLPIKAEQLRQPPVEVPAETPEEDE
jgi:hypothetical protein